MFEIPEDLPLELAPLAWLLGRWQGWGMLASELDGEDQVIVQEAAAEVVGKHVRMVTSFYRAQTDESMEPTWNAAQGLDVVEVGDLFRQETTYWKTGFAAPEGDRDPGEAPRELYVTQADTQGLASLWVGVALGPRIRLVSDVIAREPDSPPAANGTRMYGLVGSELFWTVERSLGEDAEPTVEISGRLERVRSFDE